MTATARRRNWCWTLFKTAHEVHEHPDLRYCVYQYERCPDTQREHFQGYAEFSKALTMDQVKAILGDRTMHLEPRRKTRKQARDYCMKKDTRINPDAAPVEIGIWTGGDERARTDLSRLREEIAACATFDDVLALPDQNSIARYLTWARLTYDRSRPRVPDDPQIDLHPWQVDVCDLLDQPVVKRRIIWIWSAASGTGKSTFCDYICRKARTLIARGNLNDIIYAYDSHEVIWFDLARQDVSSQYDNVPYATLELLSNASIQSCFKYQSTNKLVKAHIVVTANKPPKESRLPNRFHIINCD